MGEICDVQLDDSIEKVFTRYGNHYQTRQFGSVEVYIYSYNSIDDFNKTFSAELRFTVENNVTAITLMTVE